MTNLMSVLPVMGAERVVYYREAGARPYSVWGYGFALAIVELPYILLQVGGPGVVVPMGAIGRGAARGGGAGPGRDDGACIPG
jgi:hypothetical protein